ncbi:hypothetical protein [Paenibacillus sp. RC67]|uniref:hypothetical protein n=1 Tax=Paenibacillus sp. RC67 TaxID=3039392 RepID=UPI0024AC8DF9|nr:hypothetical protein [Paenibacillus sp. RC67]
MNISGLIKSFLGDAQPSEPKTLELKSGEVVKGMVMQVLSEQDAILNIGGVQVRAKLETPLKQGEVTMLQVQPESASGQIVLKPLDASVVKIADGSLVEILKNVGLADTASNRQLIQALHQAGITLNKETIKALAQLQSQLPASIAQEEWLPSAIIAQQKGIPLTPESVNAVRAAVAGPAFHETLQQLDSQVSKLLSDNPGISASTKVAIDTFKLLMASVREMSTQLLPQSTTAEDTLNNLKSQVPQESRQASAPTINNNNQASSFTTASAAGQQAGSVENEMAQTAGTARSMEQAAQTSIRTATTGTPVAANSSNPVPEQQLMSDPKGTAMATAPANGSEPVQKMNPGGQEARSVSSQTTAAQSINEQTFSGAQNDKKSPFVNEQAKNEIVRSNNTPPHPTGGSAASASVELKEEQSSTAVSRSTTDANEGVLTSPKGGQASEHWIPKLMKALGVDHESQLFKLPEMKANENPVRMDGASLQPQSGVQSAGLNHEQLKMADSLKSVLMQLSQSQDIPPAMKETVQQAVQQITGQQLMLNSDRSSMFTHITMFVPLLNANGEQTAAIHIQSRKGKRGEIDAQNCRLVFDLRMKALGDTMVDVKVVDRIVSLQVMNDQPFLHNLLDSYREEIASSLSGIGYQFISLKCSPYPEKGLAAEESSTPSNLQEASLPARLLDLYGSKQYKGMDVKV